jgi:spermidine synthase
MTGLLYVLFFCSGASGLIYQVVWVRVFGNVFGNTIYSASLVVAIFMLGLGAGSYLAGVWADRRYQQRPDSLLRAYACAEVAIGVLGLGISALLPQLEQLSALASSYTRNAQGWFVLSAGSHAGRAAIAALLMTPITMLMGGTLTLLVRHLVRADVTAGAWRIGVLYAVNTAGAALGCLLTDLLLVPTTGLRATQTIAIALNLVSGVGALLLARMGRLKPAPTTARKGRLQPAPPEPVRGGRLQPALHASPSRTILIAAALALSGFAAMGMEILWFRHFSILLGEFRAVFSLLLGIILLGIAAGSLAGGFVHRRTTRPLQWLIVVQGLFIGCVLLGLATASADAIRSAGLAHAAALSATGHEASGLARAFEELWFNAVPMLLEVAPPALLMGFSFPLGNAVIQDAERSVGRRAGTLYLANTIGGVAGSLASGFLLVPALGIQGSATVLMLAAAAALIPLYLAAPARQPIVFAAAVSALVALVALGSWLQLPADHVIRRALVYPIDKLVTLSEGVTEVIAIADSADRGRMLLTNGHPMSSTDLLSQRYMRALAHIPLLSIERPEDVLVMCFGVGNTAHAATLHPSVRRIDIADLSQHVLAHAGYFADVNGGVLQDARVAVHVNDGRHHLRMRPQATYDLITLEPPPIVHAGVGSLYSREFYALARTRLKPQGYLTQWLPVSQVSEATNLAMVRAFIDVFPQSVLLSGAHSNLVLVGVNDSRIEIDPARIATALANAPAAHADLRRLDLGTVREIVGTFVASAATLVNATAGTAPATDDRPIQEYSARSLLKFGGAPPASIVDVSQVAAWCPSCFASGKPSPLVDGLDTYLALLNLSYQAASDNQSQPAAHATPGPRVIAGSAYLGAVVPESPRLHNLLGEASAARGLRDDAIAEFRQALRLDPDSAAAHWNLARTMTSPAEALPHLRRFAELEPRHAEGRYQLATALLESRQYDEAIAEFRTALQLMPGSAEVRNNLGVTLASQGRLDEAIDHFQQALAVRPEFADARRNLAMALEKRRQTTPSH